MRNYNMISLFAGIGGIDLAFKKTGINTILANEIDTHCAITYKLNHKNELLINDIIDIKIDDIPTSDILSGGFPCQPFSVAGYRKGLIDDRGKLFFQIIRILNGLKIQNRLPKVVFLENVKNLYSHNEGRTYEFIKKELETVGYFVTEKILNTCDYGNIPQNRERLYIIGFISETMFSNFNWIDKIKLVNSIEKVIDFNANVEEKYYYNKNSKFYNLLNENIKYNNIYQFRRIYIRENKNKLCPTLTANMGMGGHNVPLIRCLDGRIRKLTPRECFDLQGFPKSFIIPKDISNSHIYKQIGNSVSIPVVQRIATEIKKVLNYG